MSREKFARRFAQVELTPLGIVAIRRLATMAWRWPARRGSPPAMPTTIMCLACTLAGNTDLIVSGDKHLLDLGGDYQGIRIVAPAEAVQLIGRCIEGKLYLALCTFCSLLRLEHLWRRRRIMLNKSAAFARLLRRGSASFRLRCRRFGLRAFFPIALLSLAANRGWWFYRQARYMCTHVYLSAPHGTPCT